MTDLSAPSTITATTTVMWWGQHGRPTDDLDALFQQRQDSGDGRQVVLALNPRGAWYDQSGLCQLERRQAPPRIGPSTTMDDAAKNWLFEFTSIIAAHGFLHPDAAGVSDIDAEVTAGITEFQRAQKVSPDGWIGPETWSAATVLVCSNDGHETVIQLVA